MVIGMLVVLGLGCSRRYQKLGREIEQGRGYTMYKPLKRGVVQDKIS